MKEKVNDALKQHFRPEFLNRIDDTIVFHELSRHEVTEIVDLMIKRVTGQLEGQGLGLELTPAAKTLLAERGYDPTLGARPLRRAIQRMVEDSLSERLLWKEFRAGETIIVDAEVDPESTPTRRSSPSAPSRASSPRPSRWPRPDPPSNPSPSSGRPGAGATRRGATLPAVFPAHLRRRLASVLLVGVVLVLSGCHVKLQVDTRVDPDGSGVVTVAVGLDADAVSKVGDLRSQLRVDDLKAAGWTVVGPAARPTGTRGSAPRRPSPTRPRPPRS